MPKITLNSGVAGQDPAYTALRPIILCGGSGARLWPLSRLEYPKQFIQNDKDGKAARPGNPGKTGKRDSGNLFTDTVFRAMAVPGALDPLVLCNENQRFLAAASLQEIGVRADILLEHKGRNTAPAVALAALAAQTAAGHEGEDPCLLVLPSDHLIRPQEAFVDAVTKALPAACAGFLVSLGVVPDSPATGYGYIMPEREPKKGVPEEETGLAYGRRVRAFVEKPAREKAEALLAEGSCFWNSGIFLFRAGVFLDELARLRPDMLRAVRSLWDSRRPDLDFTRFSAELCELCPADSIDYAVMERTDRAAVVPLEAEWSDLGNWRAMYEAADKDDQGNVALGDTLLEDVSASYVRAGSRLVAALGVRDMIVVESPDAVLVAPQDRAQDVKKILERLQADDREEARNHVRVFRPWGNYQALALGGRFQVKRIEVKPGASLSLQRHHHRAEHWVVVSGTARITRGGKQFLLSEDQSSYIPLGTEHRLENPGRIPLVIIEIQTGAYLDEDDIVRLDDNYGRFDADA